MSRKEPQAATPFKKRSPIEYYIVKNKYTKSDTCKLLGITRKTLYMWISDPGLIRLKDIILLSGYFKVDYVHFTFLLMQNRQKVKKADRWYLTEVLVNGDIE